MIKSRKITASCTILSLVTFVASSFVSAMQFKDPVDPQHGSPLCHLPPELYYDLMVYDGTRASVRTVLNLQQTCRAWCTTLNHDAKKSIVKSWWSEVNLTFDDETYDIGLALILANFTTPENIDCTCKIPEVFLLVKANPNYINEINGTLYTSTSLLVINSQFACTQNIKNLLNSLIICGADINLGTRNEYSPFQRAVRSDATELVAYFLSRKTITIDHTDFEGNTALHHAATNLKPNMVKLLLHHGANRTIKNNAGQTAEQAANDVQLFSNADVHDLLTIDNLLSAQENSPAPATKESARIFFINF